MTNFEYILSNLSDRDFSNLISGNLNETSFLTKIDVAFGKWRDSLAGIKGNMYYIDDPNHQPNVFTTPVFHFYRGAYPKDMRHFTNKSIGTAQAGEYNKYAMPRKETLSIEIWLSKPYNSEEWKD